ncbi:hypothetical protein NQT66_13555 [Cellulophaga baltica]|jgi:hypothetical protein|uniref:hypothetical protein n=1 Tax=Cellulophaga baltica TaxID=76594 RepID=UPI0021496855|nr:hypothetical protein [Cellulophaga baltica]MCR1025843.1 hypothetical protein [Cellulophaga baltica]
MKKNLLILLLLALYQPVVSQSTPCKTGGSSSCLSLKDRGEIVITPLNKLGCKKEKAHLYAKFPKVTSYANYVFKEIGACTATDMDPYHGQLKFTYCLPKTCQEIRITIFDFNDPYFKTESGSIHKEMYLMAFDTTPASAIIGAHAATSINHFDKEIIVSPRFGSMGGSSDIVGYLAYDSNQYLISIEIDDDHKKFKKPSQVAQFIGGYVTQIKL